MSNQEENPQEETVAQPPKELDRHTPEYFRNSFIEYSLSYNTRPESEYEFCRYVGIDEAAFYEEYNSLKALEKDIWLQWFNETIEVLNASESYAEYGSQESLLAFYYTFIETLKPNRSYILFAPRFLGQFGLPDTCLEELQSAFFDYTEELINLAAENREIVERPVITQYYNYGLWPQMLFILNFWIKDDSEEYEGTDEAIEQSVNLSFELMGRTQLDAIWDFGKFLIKKGF